MSYIARMQGKVSFSNEDNFHEAIEYLEDGKYLSEVVVDHDSMTIEAPEGTYRNLGRNVDTLLELGDSGYFVGVSNDVKWHGFVITTVEDEQEFHLEEWAEENEFKDRPNPQENAQAYSEWQTTVENAFIEEQLDNIVF